MKKSALSLALAGIIAFTAAGCGDLASQVQESAMPGFETMTVGGMWKGYEEFCGDGEWETIETQRGEKIVQYTCRLNWNQIADSYKDFFRFKVFQDPKRAEMAREIVTEGWEDTPKITAQYLISADETYFELGDILVTYQDENVNHYANNYFGDGISGFYTWISKGQPWNPNWANKDSALTKELDERIKNAVLAVYTSSPEFNGLSMGLSVFVNGEILGLSQEQRYDIGDFREAFGILEIEQPFEDDGKYFLNAKFTIYGASQAALSRLAEEQGYDSGTFSQNYLQAIIQLIKEQKVKPPVLKTLEYKLPMTLVTKKEMFFADAAQKASIDLALSIESNLGASFRLNKLKIGALDSEECRNYFVYWRKPGMAAKYGFGNDLEEDEWIAPD